MKAFQVAYSTHDGHMVKMGRIREVAQEQGRTLVWLGRQIGLERQAFNNRLNRERFSEAERLELAEALGVPVSELFPEAEPVNEVEA